MKILESNFTDESTYLKVEIDNVIYRRLSADKFVMWEMLITSNGMTDFWLPNSDEEKLERIFNIHMRKKKIKDLINVVE